MLLMCRMQLEMNDSQISSSSEYWSVSTPTGQGVLYVIYGFVVGIRCRNVEA